MRKVHTLNHIQAKFTLVTAWPEEVPCFDNSFLLDKIQGKMNHPPPILKWLVGLHPSYPCCAYNTEQLHYSYILKPFIKKEVKR